MKTPLFVGSESWEIGLVKIIQWFSDTRLHTYTCFAPRFGLYLRVIWSASRKDNF